MTTRAREREDWEEWEGGEREDCGEADAEQGMPDQPHQLEEMPQQLEEIHDVLERRLERW